MSAAKKSKTSGSARKRAAQARLSDALAAAAWTEADASLNQALTEFQRLSMAKTAGERRDAMLLLGQALRRVARKRGLEPQEPPPIRRRK